MQYRSVSLSDARFKEQLRGKKLERIETWGKNLFLIFSGNLVTKTHFLLYGSYRIDDPRNGREPRLELSFRTGKVYFYSCSFLMEAEENLQQRDPRVDLMSPGWDPLYVLKLLRKKADAYLCDLFLDQHIFAGSGNIVKNEVLFNIRRHPLTKLSEVDSKDHLKLIEAVHAYCWDFYEWKKAYQLRQHWQVYRRSTCRWCERKITRSKMGKGERMTFFCPFHQKKKRGPIKIHDVLPFKGNNRARSTSGSLSARSYH